MAKRVENIQINDVLAPPPYINKTTNTWWLYDFDSGEYVDTSIRAEGKDGADGRSPYIENGTWWEWNAETGRYEDTGVQADIEVGGVNLIQNGNFFNGLNDWNINSPIETLPETLTIYSGTDIPIGATSCLKVTATTYGQGVWQNLMNKLELNRTYTLSFLLKKSGSEEFNLYFGHEENIQTREITKTDTWERHIYRFTPTTHQNIVFYANNAATFFITNIQLEKGTVASDFKSGYLEDALKQTAEINGGLILGSIIGARDEQNIVRSYISGLKNNQTAIATGVEGFGTESEKKSIDLRHDGSGHLAGGNIKWNADGSLLEVIGKIIAQSGKIGGLDIFSDTLKSSSMSFTEKPIEPLDTLLTPVTEYILYQSSWSNAQTSSIPDIEAYTQAITITQDSVLKFKITAIPDPTKTDPLWHLTIINASDGIEFYDVGFDPVSDKLYSVGLPPGSYRIFLTVSVDLFMGESHTSTAIVKGVTEATRIEATSYIFQTKIGNDGFYSFWDAAKYMYYSALEGLKIRGAIDIPGGLGGGSASGTQEGANLWGKVISASRAGSTVTVYHNIGDLKYTVQVAMKGNSTWYYQNKTANSIQIVCSGFFDFILVRTPY